MTRNTMSEFDTAMRGDMRELDPDEIAVTLQVDDDEDAFDYSIESSLLGNHAAWLRIAELKGVLCAMPNGDAKDCATELTRLLHVWFSNQEDRLIKMQKRHERERIGT